MNLSSNHRPPQYMNLYLSLRDRIVSGVYPYGSKLPSKRTLSAESGVSVITVQHAMELLCEEGYVKSLERSGSYVIYKREDFQEARHRHIDRSSAADGVVRPQTADTRFTVPSAAESRSKTDQGTASQAMAAAGRGTTSRSVATVQGTASQAVFPFSVLAKTMRKVLQDYAREILVKSPNSGLPELRREICMYLARSRGIQVETSQVIIGSGAEYLYSLIAQLFHEMPVFALEQPSYAKIRHVYEAFGKTCEMLPLTGDGIDSQALRSAAARVLHVTPFNSFPSGITAGISKKQEYLAWAEKVNGFIIEDNYDSELTVSRKAEDPLFALTDRGNVIYLNTFSKTIAPSIRVGYMILPPSLLERFEQRLGFYSCTVPVFDQYVLAQLLKSGDYERHINRERRRRRKSRVI